MIKNHNFRNQHQAAKMAVFKKFYRMSLAFFMIPLITLFIIYSAPKFPNPITLTHRTSHSASHHPPPLICPFDAPTTNPMIDNRARLSRILISKNLTLTLLSSAKTTLRVGSDTELPGYRQTANILYVMGKFDIRNSFILLNATCPQLCVSVFLPPLSNRDIIFDGHEVNRTAVREQFLLSNVYDIQDLASVIANKTAYSESKDILDDIPIDVRNQLSANSARLQYSVMAKEALVESRFVKTGPEFQLLRYATKVALYTHKVLDEALQTWPIATESTLSAYFQYVSTICGCRLQAYNPIVGAGKHASILHFATGETSDGGTKPIKDLDFVLVDAAGAYNGYASDITRTYAIKTSPKKELLTTVVHESQKAGINAYTIGNKWSDVVNETLSKLILGMWDHGFFISDLQKVIDSGVISIFMPHGVGHPVGLEVHDPIPSKYQLHHPEFQGNDTKVDTEAVCNEGLRDQYPLRLSYDYYLERGYVHTIEPGIYFIPYLLEKARANCSGVAGLINWTMVDDWVGIGGIRIENVVAINLDGLAEIF